MHHNEIKKAVKQIIISNLISLTIFLVLIIQAQAQTLVSGNVFDANNEPIVGANVYIKNTYDGATSNLNGHFEFETVETGEQVLVISFIGYEIQEQSVLLENKKVEVQSVTLKEAFNQLDAVVISAGSFEASDEGKAAVLNSIEK